MMRVPAAWYWLGFVLCLGLLIYLLSSALTPFVAAAAIAYLLDPLANRIEHWGVNRMLATTIITVGFFALVVAALIIVVPLIEDELVNFISQIPNYWHDAEILAKRWGGPEIRNLINHPGNGLSGGQAGDLAKNALGWSAGVLRSVWSGGIAVFEFVSLFVITPIVAFYLLLDWDRILIEIDSWLPRREAPVIRQLAREIDLVISGFVRGQALVCLGVATYFGAALSLAGLPFGLVIGVASGLFSFIPYFGSAIGVVGAAIVELLNFGLDWPMIALLAGIFAFGHILEGYILAPRLVGDRVGLHPVWLIFALIAFGSLFGFLGLLLAVPLTAAIGVLLRFAIDRYLESPLYLGQGTSHGE